MIESLRLKNIKAFKDRTIPFTPLTLLSGLNGAGKSTVLQSLAMLRQSNEAGLLRDTGFLLNGELVELGVGRDVLYESAEDEWIEIELSEASQRSTWTVRYGMSEDVLQFSSARRSETSGTLFDHSFQYLRADRVNPATNYGKSYHAVNSRRFMGARGEYTAHFLSQFQNQSVSEPLRRRVNEGFTTGLLSQVNAWMQEFSPGCRVNVHDVENTDFVRLSYSYGHSAGLKGSNSYRPTNAGFGLTYSLPIVVACLSTPRGGLVLFENPEAHLHPQGQEAMGRLIALTASAGIQVIVESHSDHVLNGIRLAIKNGALDAYQATPHFFRRNDETGSVEIETPTFTAQGRLSFWPEGFFDQWDKSLDALLG